MVGMDMLLETVMNVVQAHGPYLMSIDSERDNDSDPLLSGVYFAYLIDHLVNESRSRSCKGGHTTSAAAATGNICNAVPGWRRGFLCNLDYYCHYHLEYYRDDYNGTIIVIMMKVLALSCSSCTAT